jgi:hypothetical protein
MINNNMDRVCMGMAYKGMNMVPKSRPTNQDGPTDYHPTIRGDANDHPTTPDKILPFRFLAVPASKGMLILRLAPL